MMGRDPLIDHALKVKATERRITLILFSVACVLGIAAVVYVCLKDGLG